MTELWEFTDYIQYLNAWVKTRGHGSKSVLAKTLGVQTAYLSLVLKQKAHLSLEQALRAKNLFEFGQQETEFFLLLVQKTKAGSEDLRRVIEQQIAAFLARQTPLKEKIKSSIGFTIEEQAKYFSSWHYAAVHTALLVPGLQNQKKLEDYFGLPTEVIVETIDFLEKLGLAHKQQGRLTVGPFRMHLDSDSELINMHHYHWRMQALVNIQRKRSKDLHYSSILSLSHDDTVYFKKKLMDLILLFEQRLQESKDEALFSLGIDWFEVGTSGSP
ncbi:MAG: DUF4423 domain-containing protein [Bdellovibrionaceae bacterium]|nr:DUF4423 domain-containing protein [Pseudobdellovibrionaceae bacterium]